VSLTHPVIQMALTHALTRPAVGWGLLLIATVSTAFTMRGRVLLARAVVRQRDELRDFETEER
jgi:hypothetical protein